MVYPCTLTKKRLATLDGEIVDPEITVNLEMWDVLKVVHLTLIPFDTSNVILFLIKLGWGNIHGNGFSDTVFPKDTLIEIKGKFPLNWFALKTFHWRLKWDFFYQMITQETNLRKVLSDVIYRPMWRKRWRHAWSCQNKYMWYVISVPVHQIHYE